MHEGPYTKIIAIATIILVAIGYLTLAAVVKWPPFSPSVLSSTTPDTTPVDTSPAPTTTNGPHPHPSSSLRKVLYLYKIAPSSGGPVDRGTANIGAASFNRSIWLNFQVSCCGSEQSVTFSIPSGYRYFDGMLGEEEINGDSGGYVMLFSISVNNILVINSRQTQLGDPPIPIKLRLPAGSSSILIDVAANCPYFTCAGDAVVGNARLTPLHNATS